MFEKHFCPSPWFHLRINNAGEYEYCRWTSKGTSDPAQSIRTKSPDYFFQYNLGNIRQQMLNGKPIDTCANCHVMEEHKKVSGRQRQLLKTGIDCNNFDKTFLSSPWVSAFEYSQQHNGETTQTVQDWQIDLGNYCNSACLFCAPESSSRLATEFKRIGFIKELPLKNWCDDPALVQVFVDALCRSPNLAYLHFIGGETLITPAFKTILTALVDANINQEISIGFTTNLTIWDQDIVDLLVKFKEVNLGMSIECFHPLNDYLRYGGTIDHTQELISKWVELGKKHRWLMSLRVTPTLFSIYHLDTVYEYAMKNKLMVESCNFLANPEFMRISVLPTEYRQQAKSKLMSWINGQPMVQDKLEVNARHPDRYATQIIQDALSFVHYLDTQPDEGHRLSDLVTFITRMEQSRKNSILNYLPEYEKLLRDAGYQPRA